MENELAKEASFDSGKAVLDAGKKFVIDTAKVVGGAMTGNVGMAASGAEGLMGGSDANEPQQVGEGPTDPQPGIPPLGDPQQDDWLDETTSEFSEDSDFDIGAQLTENEFGRYNTTPQGGAGLVARSAARSAFTASGVSSSTTIDELSGNGSTNLPGNANGNTFNIATLEVGTLNAKNMGQDKENEKMDLKDGLSEKDLPGNEEKEKMSLADRMAQALLYGNPANIGSGIKDKTAEVKDKLKQTRVAETLGSAKDSFAKTGVGKVTVAGAKRIGAGVRYLRSDAGKEQLLAAGKSLDALRQTMYLSGQAPNDTQFFNDAGNHLKASGEAKINQFIENKNNIEYVKKLHGYKDDPTKGTADAQAKARLESASKFLKYGVNNVAVADRLVDYKKENGLTVEQAVLQYGRSEENKQALREQASVKSFVKDDVQMNIMANIVADRLGIPSTERSKPENVKIIQKETIKEVQKGAPYMAAGVATSADDINRMNKLASEIAKNVKLSKNASVPQITIKAEKIVNQALKDGVEKVDIPNPNKKEAVKQLQDVCNKELKERK